VLVLPDDTELPRACVHCGRCVELPENYSTLSWVPPWAYALILLGILGIIAMAILRKKISVRIPICDFHKERYRNLRLAGVVMTLFSVAPIIVVIAANFTNALTGLGFLLAISDCVGGIILLSMKPLRPTYICRTHSFLKGADKQFLAMLPEMIDPVMAMRAARGGR
jgi:hypothetical protein